MWFKVDDGWVDHAKTRRATALGRALWIVAGVKCAQTSTEGIVSDVLLNDCLHFAQVPREAARALVRCGLWHDSRTIQSCPGCLQRADGKLPRGSFVFHDWHDYQFSRDEAKIPEARAKKMKRRDLSRDRVLCDRIQHRDGMLCRYCGIRVSFKDRRGPAGATYDHVDPDGPNTFENVVVACRHCNGIKRDRTPEEAEMPLLPPRTMWTKSGLVYPTPGPENLAVGQENLAGNLASRARGAQEGHGPGRAGSVKGSGQVDSAQDGAGPVGSELVGTSREPIT